MYNFLLVNCDTDSITVCKQDMTEFSKEEQENLLNELNSQFDELINFSDDGYFKRFIVLRAKNYIMDNGKKIKYKGSSLKSSTLELALKEFLQDIINAILNDQTNYTDIYNKYVKEIENVIDIKRWCSKKTISEKTLKSERANESKLRDALEGTEYVEGDKPFVYFKSDDSLSLMEKFDGDYHKDRLYKKLYNCTDRFSEILPVDELFLNYSLKRNKKVLVELLNIVDNKQAG